MKKIFITLLILVALALGALYYFIPGTLVVAEAVSVNCNRDAAFRNLSGGKVWAQWGIRDTAADTLQQGFVISKTLNSAFEIAVTQHGKTIQSKLVLIPSGKNLTIINWECALPASTNPLQRIADYRAAVAIKKSMDTLAAKLKTYLAVFENLYGFPLQEGSTTDTLLIITKSFLPAYPATGVIYEHINKLKDFCTRQGCSVTGSPMVNITAQDQQYQLMTALSVNRVMLAKGDVYPGKMVPGKFIITEVKGGEKTVENTLQQIRLYFQDYGRTSMAIPFSYLITDRQQEPDSTRWITRIYAPVY